MPEENKKDYSNIAAVGIAAVIIGAIYLFSHGKSNDVDDYKCKNRDKAVINFRDNCMQAILGIDPFSIKEANVRKLCRCVENKTNWLYLYNEKCELPGFHATIPQFIQGESINAACGDVNNPIE